jgi:hypothetical protein
MTRRSRNFYLNNTSNINFYNPDKYYIVMYRMTNFVCMGMLLLGANCPINTNKQLELFRQNKVVVILIGGGRYIVCIYTNMIFLN